MKYALVIGNSKYQDMSLAELITPSNDAADLAQVLRDPDICGFDDVQLLSEESMGFIVRAIARFFRQRKPDDLLLLYFSGHGVRDENGDLYLAVKDTEHDLLSGSAIPSEFITKEMDHTRSRRVVLVLDCCYSGAFVRTKGVGDNVDTASAFKGAGYGRMVLTASTATQYAWEGDKILGGDVENSVFTYYLVDGLRTWEADTDNDGQITVSEWYNYTYDKVLDKTSKQTPSMWAARQQGEILIATNARPMFGVQGLLSDLHQSTKDRRRWIREGAVRELGRQLKVVDPVQALIVADLLGEVALVDVDEDVKAIANEILKAYADAVQPPGEITAEHQSQEESRYESPTPGNMDGSDVSSHW